MVFGLQAQRGKESILLDLSTDAGQEVLGRLIAQADAVAMNGTDAQRARLGLTPERLDAVNPRLVLVQLDAFGGPKRGPKSDHLGYDDLAQAATGVMVRFGGGMETPEEHAHFGTIASARTRGRTAPCLMRSSPPRPIPHCTVTRARLRSQPAGRWPAPSSTRGETTPQTREREAPPRPVRAGRNRGQVTQESRSSVPGIAVKCAGIRNMGKLTGLFLASSSDKCNILD